MVTLKSPPKSKRSSASCLQLLPMYRQTSTFMSRLDNLELGKTKRPKVWHVAFPDLYVLIIQLLKKSSHLFYLVWHYVQQVIEQKVEILKIVADFFCCKKCHRQSKLRPWRLGVVVIISANKTEDRGFESRQGVRFLGLYTLQCCSL
jgi:hypothetical protein